MRIILSIIAICYSVAVFGQGQPPSSLQGNPDRNGVLIAKKAYWDRNKQDTLYQYVHSILPADSLFINGQWHYSGDTVDLGSDIDTIVGNEFGNVMISNDSLFYKPMPDSAYVFKGLVSDDTYSYLEELGPSGHYWKINMKAFGGSPETPVTVYIDQSLNGVYLDPYFFPDTYVMRFNEADSDPDNEHGILRRSNDSLFYMAGDFEPDLFITKIDTSNINERGNITISSDSIFYQACPTCPVEFKFELPDVIMNNYAELRAYTGTSKKIIVKDFTYTLNSISYTTVGGVFYRSTGTENGGTRIVASNGVVWQRVWDGINILPEWWEVGGKNEDGTAYTTFNAGGGIANDNERIIAASIVGGDGSNIILQKNKTYLIWERIPIYPGQTFAGNNATLKRGDLISSTGSFTAGSNTVTVTNGSIWRVGMRINAASGTLFDQNDGNQGLRITGISGNVITLSANASRSVSGTIFVNDDILSNVAGTSVELFKIQGINFDGNKASNNVTIDWRYGVSVSLGSNNSTTSIDNCHFKNTPGENIFISKGSVTNSSYKNLNGSFLHISNSTPTLNGIISVQNCFGDSTNINPTGMGHSEAVFTFSAYSIDVVLNNCNFKNGEGAIFGALDVDDDKMTVTGCSFTNYPAILYGGSSTIDVNLGNITISDNKFYNTGELNFKGRNLTTGYGTRNIVISNNLFINPRFYFNNCSHVVFEGNICKWDESFSIKADYANYPPNFNQPSYFTIHRCSDFLVKNNLFEGATTYNSFLAYGILIVHNNTLKSGTNFFYYRNINIEGNTVKNFKYSIYSTNIPTGLSARAIAQNNQWVNLVIKNNIIESHAGSGTGQLGIEAEPGALVEGNTVITNTTGSYSILALGINTTSKDSYIGAKVFNNRLLGNAIFYIGGESVNNHNLQCFGNEYDGTLSMQSATLQNGYIVDNYKIQTFLNVSTYLVP